MARFWVTCNIVLDGLILGQGSSYLPFAFLYVNLVAEDNKWKVLRIMRTCLNKKLIAPAVERLKRLCAVNVIHEHTAVRPSVVGHAQRLEALLPSRIPELSACVRETEQGERGKKYTCIVTNRSSTMTSLVRLEGIQRPGLPHTHAHPQVGTDGGLVLVAKPLVHVLVHERGLADSAYTPPNAMSCQPRTLQHVPAVPEDNNLRRVRQLLYARRTERRGRPLAIRDPWCASARGSRRDGQGCVVYSARKWRHSSVEHRQRVDTWGSFKRRLNSVVVHAPA